MTSMEVITSNSMLKSDCYDILLLSQLLHNKNMVYLLLIEVLFYEFDFRERENMYVEIKVGMSKYKFILSNFLNF